MRQVPTLIAAAGALILGHLEPKSYIGENEYELLLLSKTKVNPHPATQGTRVSSMISLPPLKHVNW